MLVPRAQLKGKSTAPGKKMKSGRRLPSLDARTLRTRKAATEARIVLGIAQQLQDTFCEMFVDLGVARNGLGNLRGGIVILVVLSTMTDKHTTDGFKFSKEVVALHRSVSSASLRTPGISPLVRSRYRSRRWDCRSSNDSPCVQ